MPQPLADLARRPRPTDIAGVVGRMRAIEAALPAAHGVACFSRLYRWTTENVGGAVTGARFEAPEAMVALDVVFANLFFDAVDAWALGRPVPGAWAPLMKHGGEAGISPLRFALAGMHAHIDRDLAVAVVLSAEEPPAEGTPRYRDYCRVNRVLEATSDAVRARLLPDVLQVLDAEMGELDDKLVITSISAARKAAWEVAEVLWHAHGNDTVWRAALACLDTAVGNTARVLLLEPDLPRPVHYVEQVRHALGT